MRFTAKKAMPLILIVGSLVSAWFLIANLQPVKPALYAFALCLVLGIYMLVRVYGYRLHAMFERRVLDVVKHKKFVPIALSLTIFLGLTARLIFYFKFKYQPISDPVTFYDAAKILADKHTLVGSAYSGYVAFQPYLSAYNNLLSLAVKIFNDPWIATIFLNTLFDVLSSVIIYIFLRTILKKRSGISLLAFCLWMLSPINIVFSVLSLPIAVVNFFVLLSLLISCLLVRYVTRFNTVKIIYVSVILGFVLGIGNCFRPIFMVVLLALIVILLCSAAISKKPIKILKLSALSILIASFLFALIQSLNLAFVSRQTGLVAAKDPSGWTIYVGSSWETAGDWREYHNDEMTKICWDALSRNDYDGCHAALKREAINRYKSYGPSMTASLFIQKLYHQSESQGYFYNAEQSIAGYKTSNAYKIIGVYTTLFLVFLFAFSVYSMYAIAKNLQMPNLNDLPYLFIALLLIGWFFSFALVQSAPRYSAILYPLFTLFSVLGLEFFVAQKRTSK